MTTMLIFTHSLLPFTLHGVTTGVRLSIAIRFKDSNFLIENIINKYLMMLCLGNHIFMTAWNL